ncbi:MAG TPA: acyl-CoA desaturase [Pirellulales bacterium]|jgi:linoleoyl-CoA desaturase|nr:acyl-CoA desaturase [Pirellulales bacterium]
MSANDVQIKFGRETGFQTELRRRVEHYFATTGRRPRDCPRMYLKTAIVLTWFAVSYALLVFWAAQWWTVLPLALSLGLSMAGIGFNIQHDGGHSAYSDRPLVNRIMAMSLDLLGGSSYFWARKHNSIHHNYTNITDHDDDIDIGFLGRLSPHQPRLGFHRFQHYYLWLLYGLMPAKWHVYDDFRDWASGRIGSGPHRVNRPKGWDMATLLAGKAVFVTWAWIVPALLHPLWVVLLVYLAATYVEGVAMAIVFQLAHCVEEAGFPLPCPGTPRVQTSWAEHQVETTVDFARDNPIVNWYTGGLNFQVEHHLFPRICHIHYPALSRVVEDTCREFGLRYLVNRSFRHALASHFRLIRRLGAEGPIAEADHLHEVRSAEFEGEREGVNV